MQYLIWRWSDGETHVTGEAKYPTRLDKRQDLKVMAQALIEAETPEDALAQFNRVYGYDRVNLPNHVQCENCSAGRHVGHYCEFCGHIPEGELPRTHHHELIVCPNCQSHQLATVYHTVPFWMYFHGCSVCNHAILESDWDPVHTNANIQVGEKVVVRSLVETGTVVRFVGGQVLVDLGEGVGETLVEWSDLVRASEMQATSDLQLEVL